MKIPSTDLFDLIKSLEASELRYLRVQAGDPAPGYWRLLEAVRELDKYDESELKLRHRGAGWLKHLSVNKRYLIHWILDHLDRYRRKTVDEECWDELDRISTWLDRQIPKPAESAMRKLRKKAERYELFGVLLQICRLEKSLPTRGDGPGGGAAKLEALFHREQRILHQLMNQNQYWYLLNRLYEMQRRQAVDEADLTRWEQHPLLREETGATNLQSRIYFHQARAILAFTRKDTSGALAANQASLALLDANPQVVRLYPERYLSILNNYLVDCLVAERQEELKQGLDQLRSLPQRREFRNLPKLEVRVFRQSYLLEINQLIRDGRYVAGMALLPRLTEGLHTYAAQLARHHRLTLTYLTAYLYFQNRRWSEALEWLQPLARQERKDVVLEVLGYARLLFLLVHFELGNEELLVSLLASYRRSERKGMIPAGTERWLLRYLGRAIRTGNREITERERAKLADLRSHPREGRFFEYIDLWYWAGERLL